jgi:hypothetical protein
MGEARKYNNTVSTPGLSIVTRAPIDDRSVVDTLQILEDLLGTPTPTEEQISFLGGLYEGHIVTVVENSREYIWKESAYGIMPIGYTYPVYMTNEETVNYANKVFNFVLKNGPVVYIASIATLGDNYIEVPNRELSTGILDDKLSVNVMMKSSLTSYTEMELPDSIQSTATGIKIIFDPAPGIGEVLKITII